MKIIYTNLLVIILFLFNSLSIFSQNSQTPFIQLTSPNGGEKWEANSTQTITWQSTGVAKVKIEYSLSNGLSWHVISYSTDASLDNYSWTVPNSQTSYVLIKISDESNPSIYDVSNNRFSIYQIISKKKSTSLNKITTVTSSTAVKIMPLGDSIAQGLGDDTTEVGWREDLFNALTNDGYNFSFVGNLVTGLEDNPTENLDFYNNGRHHEGHSGIEVGRPEYIPANATMLDTINSILNDNSGNPPQIILFHIGTNDLDNSNNPTQVAKQIDTVLGKIDTFATNNSLSIKTIFAKIIYDSHAQSGAQNTMNTVLQNKYDSLLNIGRNVSLINMYSSVLSSSQWPYYFSYSTGPSDYSDVHPSGATHQHYGPYNGYARMASALYTKLQTILPLLQVKVYLQGPYDAASGLMSTNINSNLPSTSPYQDSNSNSAYLNGSNYVVIPYDIPADITDWVQIEIRGSDGTTVIESKSCFLREDGQVIDPDGLSEDISLGIPPGNYYVVVKHRNHLAVMSADLVELNGITSYDFTTGSDKYYGASGGAIPLGGGVWGMVAGNADTTDQKIYPSDYAAIKTDALGGLHGYQITDIDMDGNVYPSDYAIAKTNALAGYSSKVPSSP